MALTRAVMPILMAAAVLLMLPGLAVAQDLPPLPGAGGDAGQALQQGLDGIAGGVGRNAALLVLLLTALSFAPGLAIAVTCFPFIVTVMSILRQSIGLPQSPPNMLIVVLSLFLSWFVMDPTLREAWNSAGRPLQQGAITLTEAVERGMIPFRRFMEGRTDPDTLATLAAVAPGAAAGSGAADDGDPDGAAEGPAGNAAGEGAAPEPDAAASPDQAPLSVLIPSFMLSEVQRAFEVGFLIALPFLIIDLVVSAVLMSMGMMMVPPAVVALPFKLAFFVVVDGWGMVASALVRSYQ